MSSRGFWGIATCTIVAAGCRPSLEARPAAPVAEASTTTPATPVAAEPAKELRDPPSGAGGFRFDMPIKDARAACESYGHRWQVMEHSNSCDGSIIDVGFPASIALYSCDGAVCRVDLIVTPPNDEGWTPMFGTINKQLTEKYGEPTDVKRNLPESCQDTLAACVRDGKASFRYEWAWPGRQAIRFMVGRANGMAVMQLSYVSPSFANRQAPGL